jgi:hypothetical protein
MTNTIDLFQPEFQQLALPAATAAVFLDGALCEDLEPIEIVRSGWPEFGWVRLSYRGQGLGTPPSPPDPPAAGLSEWSQDWFAMGKAVRLCQLYNGAPPSVAVAGLPLFVGQIEAIETTIGGDGERIEIVAKDFSAVLRRITVYGRRVLQNDGSTVLLPGLETVFNPLGAGNAAPEPVVLDGKARTVFYADANGARAWTCAEAIHHLLCEYVPSGLLHGPDIEQLLALTESRPVRDLDVTGLSLLEALHRCSAAVGIRFQLLPRLAETGPGQALVFSRAGHGRTVELNRQYSGELLNLSRTNIGVLHSERSFYPVTHRYIGQGDFKVYEATFELVRAWDPALEDIDYGTFSASTNPEFYKVRDVYRKWCLNEAGDYTAVPYNQGPPYDFSRLFERADYVRRQRRFWPALSTNAQGEPLGYFLQASFDYGLHWWEYRYAFNNLLDECGIWLSSDQLDVDTWVAAVKGLLRFRITASVAGDERLTCIVADGPVGSTMPVVDHVLTLPRQFKYRKVTAQSLLASSSGAGSGQPDEVDDSAALHQFVRQRAAASPAIIETVAVQTPGVLLHFEPGDCVTSDPDSRDLLSRRRDNRSTTWIERVHVDFRNQCTNLNLVRQRVAD